jgi:Tetratricopeptide repeat
VTSQSIKSGAHSAAYQFGAVFGDVTISGSGQKMPISFGSPAKLGQYFQRALKLEPVTSGGLARRSILGQRGVGKSQMASQYLSEILDSRPGVSTFWVDVRSLDLEIPKLACLLAIHQIELQDLEQTAAQIRRSIETLEGPWILVLDGYDRPDVVLERLVPFVCRERAEIVVTTTDKRIAKSFSHTPTCVGIFSSTEALEFLRTEPEDCDLASERSAFNIASHLGFHPLALGVARGQRLRYESLTSFSDRIRSNVTKCLTEYPDGYSASLVDLFRSALTSLDEDSLGLVHAIMFLAPGQISLGLLPFANDVARQLRAIGALEESGLITSRAMIGPNLTHVGINPVIQSAGKIVFADSRELIAGQCLQRARQWYLASSQGVLDGLELVLHVSALAFSTGEDKTDVFALCTMLLEQLRVGLVPRETLRILWDTVDRLGPFDMGSGGQLALLRNLAMSFRWAGQTKTAIELCDTLVRRSTASRGPLDEETIECRASLGIALWSAKRFAEAVPIQEGVALERRNSLNFGPDHLATLVIEGSLAASYREVGRAVDALPLEHHVLSIREAVLDPDDALTNMARSNLASTMHELRDFQGALELMERVFVDSKRLLGEFHPHTLLNGLSLVKILKSNGQNRRADRLGRDIFRTVELASDVDPWVERAVEIEFLRGF